MDSLVGDASKARAQLGWAPSIGFEQLVHEMVEADFAAAQRDSLVRDAGFQAYDRHG